MATLEQLGLATFPQGWHLPAESPAGHEVPYAAGCIGKTLVGAGSQLGDTERSRPQRGAVLPTLGMGPGWSCAEDVQ